MQTLTLGIAAQHATPLHGAPNELTASVSPASGCPAVDFARKGFIEVCAPGTFISIGDFNRDGKSDLAVGYQGAANFGCTNSGVSIFAGNGDGTFQFSTKYDMPGPLVMAGIVGDFNKDGNPDLAILDYGAYSPGGAFTNGGAWLLLNRGDGTFKNPEKFGAGTNSSCFVVGDFNGDGNLDLAVASVGAMPLPPAPFQTTFADVGVLLGNGDGTFMPAIHQNAGQGQAIYPTALVAGDFDGDGKLDLAIYISNAPGLRVLLGRGNGLFGPPILSQTNYLGGDGSLGVGDFNGDGKLDLVLATGSYRSFGWLSPGAVSISLGNGDGTFLPRIQYGPSANWIVPIQVADLNGDGKLDVITGFWPTNSNSILNVFLGRGDGSVAEPVTYDAGQPTSSFTFAAGDLNADGTPDLVTTVATGSIFTLSAALNSCDSTGVRLRIDHHAETNVLSWPSTVGSFVLESSTNLHVQKWQLVAEPPMVSFGQWEIAVPGDQPQRFFRLRQP